MGMHLELSVQETRIIDGDRTPYLVVWLSENKGRQRLLASREVDGPPVDVRGEVSIKGCRAFDVIDSFEQLLAENGYGVVHKKANTDHQGRNLGRGYVLHPRLAIYAGEVFSGLESWASGYSDPKRVWC